MQPSIAWRPLDPGRFPRTDRVRRLLVAVDSLQHDWLDRAEQLVLLHNDMRQNNLLWRHGRLSGVVDWSDARLGPAVSDVAYLTVDIVRTNGSRAAQKVVDAYQAIRGPVDDLPRWQALWLASQLPFVHRWSPVQVPGGRLLTRSLVTRRLHRFGDTILSQL